jgi:hypothetical protein
VKLAVDTLPTVPEAPPAAGPDRALVAPSPAVPPAAGPDPALGPLPDPPAKPLPGTACPVLAEADAVADADVARPTESPITAHISAAAAIHPANRFDGHRRALGQRTHLAVVTGADQPSDDAGGAGGAGRAGFAPSTDLATGGPDFAFDTGSAGLVSERLVGS